MQITVYSSSSCGPCLRLKRRLEADDVDFRVVDKNDHGPEFYDGVDKYEARGVPFTVVEDENVQVIYGYDELLVDELIEKYHSI